MFRSVNPCAPPWRRSSDGVRQAIIYKPKARKSTPHSKYGKNQKRKSGTGIQYTLLENKGANLLPVEHEGVDTVRFFISCAKTKTGRDKRYVQIFVLSRSDEWM